MTFGAMRAWEALALAGAVSALAAWLFLRKVRPPRLVVASLLLWQRVLDEPRALTLWERIRRAVSLVLTVAIAAALALAIARPSPRSADPSTSRGRLLIVIDSSWSMLAKTRGGPTRWDRAVAEARRIAAAAGDRPAALATTADGLVEGPTTDGTLLESALDRLAPYGGDATAWPELAGADEVHFLTDGTVARRLPDAVIVHSVFEPAANVGITAFDVRPSGSSAEPADADRAADAYLEVANFGPAAQEVRVTVTRGDAVVLDRRVSIAAGGALRQILPLARSDEAALQARVQAPENALEADDRAYAWIADARPAVVTVVGQDTAWLRPLVTGDPGMRASFVDPSRYDLAVGDAPRERPAGDLLIFDRWAPAQPPSTPAIYVAPPPDVAWLAPPAAAAAAWRAGGEKRPRWISAGTHPVLRGVDPVTFTIEGARPFGAPGLFPIARSAAGTPLVYAADSAARRFVLLTFGPGESNLASAPGFPVLMGNAVEWLLRPDARGAQATGLASFSETTVRVAGPGGEAVPLVGVPGARLGVLRTPGLYVAEAAGAKSTFAVNAGDPQVSNTSRTTVEAGGRARAVAAQFAGRAWWRFLTAAVFLLALLEWWTWQRRITV